MSPIWACGSGSIGASWHSPTGARSTAFAAELIDRFGPLPSEVENLLKIIAIKRACREAGVEKSDADVALPPPAPSLVRPQVARRA